MLKINGKKLREKLKAEDEVIAEKEEAQEPEGEKFSSERSN